MSPERWRQVKAILQAALDQPAAARSQFVEDACTGDAGLAADVRDLLRFEEDGDSDSALPVTKWRTAGEPEAIAEPQRAGPYRILRRLGEGGMGVVYLAARDDGEYRQQVAIKVVKPGANAAGIVRRFRRERQILAELQHPNIARLIDSGTTDTGQLFYVMEYVDGEPLTAYAEHQQLTLHQRLELFVPICEAVAHAHRKLVIHGDIKPGNILVDAMGVPKLVDFGLARVFEAGHAGEPAPASTTVAMLTPEYASPEQVRGEYLSTSTDVYSLGVVLYELLTGQSPYSRRGPSPLDTYRAICEQEPGRPSSVVRRGVSASALIARPQQLKGDLDDIVLRALRKEPEHRYGSVVELARDIERHLGGFPVRASRGTSVYRFRKFVTRHRWGVTVTAAGTLLSIAAAGVIWWQGWQARQRFNDLRQLAHAVVFELHDAIQDLPGSTAARKLLVERALVYLRNLDASAGKNRELQLELALAYDKIGQVQGSQGRANLGDLSGALASFGRARQILLGLARDATSDLKLRDALATVDEHLSDIYEQRGEMPRWRELRREATALRRAMAREHPETPRYRAAALWDEAYTLSGENRPAEAAAAYEQTLAANREAAAREPHDAALVRTTARIHRNLAHAYSETGRRNEALAHYRQALQIDMQRTAAAPGDMRTRMELSWDYVEIGWIQHELRRDREAEASFAQSLALQQEMAAADPQNWLARLEIGKLKLTAAPASEAAGDRARAIAYLQDASAIFQAALQRDPSNDDARFHLAQTWSNLADIYLRTGAHGDPVKRALACYEQAAEALRGVRLDGRPEGGLDPRPLSAHVARRLAGLRRNVK